MPRHAWLSVEILAWLLAAARPFTERFRWPQLALTNRDRRAGLPFSGDVSDLDRLQICRLPQLVLGRGAVVATRRHRVGFGPRPVSNRYTSDVRG